MHNVHAVSYVNFLYCLKLFACKSWTNLGSFNTFPTVTAGRCERQILLTIINFVFLSNENAVCDCAYSSISQCIVVVFIIALVKCKKDNKNKNPNYLNSAKLVDILSFHIHTCCTIQYGCLSGIHIF